MQQLQKNKYLETTIQTATPAQLLIMLYDGAIRNCRQAIDSIQSQSYENANRYLTKAQDIISEFAITIDRSAPISESLLKLYEYFTHLLIQANVTKSEAPVQEVLGYLIELKETWMTAAKSINASTFGTKHG